MNRTKSLLALVAMLAVGFVFNCAAQNPSPLNVTDGANNMHFYPPAINTATIAPDAGPLLYHGGNVMTDGILEPDPYKLATYVIYWTPPTLQDGSPATVSANYVPVTSQMVSKYVTHGLGNNNTQYYYLSSPVYYIQNESAGSTTYTDTTPYPASGCYDSFPGIGNNCINDAQIRSEVLKVMKLNHWSGGVNHLFLVFTAKGEGSCFGKFCAYTEFCAYHSYIPYLPGSPEVIYTNEPYAETSVCQAPGVPSPNNDAEADTAASAASHEMTEAITDPLLDAWYTAQGNEIGDLCAYNYGANNWASGTANQFWAFYEKPISSNPIDNFELQQEFDNHTGTCVQLGP